jgi:hemerythrin superfamily protein
MNNPTNPMPEQGRTGVSNEENPDVVMVLRRQHDEVRSLMDSVATGTPDVRETAFRSLVPLLAVHETAEEMVVYPAFRRLGSHAESVAESRLMEEDQAKKVLADLESIGPDGSTFASVFLEFRRTIEFHAEAEEREVFPLLVQQMSVDDLASMGRAVLRAEAIAPTHAHRMAPESAVGNMVVGPFASVVDRVRDAISRARS